MSHPEIVRVASLEEAIASCSGPVLDIEGLKKLFIVGIVDDSSELEDKSFWQSTAQELTFSIKSYKGAESVEAVWKKNGVFVCISEHEICDSISSVCADIDGYSEIKFLSNSLGDDRSPNLIGVNIFPPNMDFLSFGARLAERMELLVKDRSPLDRRVTGRSMEAFLALPQ